MSGIALLIVAGDRGGRDVAEFDPRGAPVFRYFDPATAEVEHDDLGQPLPVLENENIVDGLGDLKSETVEIHLELHRAIEYKALMKQGDSIVYSWHASAGPVYYDFHAHNEAGGPEFYTRYNVGEGTSDSGAIVAPYDGQHGWYFLNLADAPQTVILEIAGFYDELVELDVHDDHDSR